MNLRQRIRRWSAKKPEKGNGEMGTITAETAKFLSHLGMSVAARHQSDGTKTWKVSYYPQEGDLHQLLFGVVAFHSAALNFLNEYEEHVAGGYSGPFTPSPEVLEAFRKAVKG